MFWTKFVEKIKTHILYSILFPPKLCHLWDNVEKSGTATQATDDNIQCMHYECWIHKARDTLRLCNTYRSSTATIVTRTHLNVTLYVHCLSYCISLGDIQLIAILLPIAKWYIWSYFKCSLNRTTASPFLTARFIWQQVQDGGMFLH